MIGRIFICWVFAATVLAVTGHGTAVAQPTGGECACDCDGDGVVALNEVILSVNIALGKSPMEACVQSDHEADGRVTVDELVAGVTASLHGCNCPLDSVSFASTWEGIQQTIFERHGCTQDVCHGSTTQGGLDLRPEVAYANLLEAPSTQSAHERIVPGDAQRSFLWLKLAAKTDPEQIPPGEQIGGAPMPQIGDALSLDELELLRLWIYSGAPETGTVMGTEDLLGACLPPSKPLSIKPLDPPAPGEGVQFVMPAWNLEAHSEHERCFASYYDISDQVPPEFLTPDGSAFYFGSQELRQDPESHHLILNRYLGPDSDIDEFGPWTCRGGELDGQACDPLDLGSCGDGICAGRIEESFACIGFGPGGGSNRVPIGGAQQAQSFTELYPGVFGAIPVSGILLWNSHAFNLTDEDHLMNGRLNYYFTDDQRFFVRGIFNVERIFAPNAPPYTTQVLCHDHVLPRYARLFNLSSHTHKHGKHFTVELNDGTLIYESFVYNDPVEAHFDPPLVFDSPNAEERTLHYCSLYNNGVAPDGSPDPDTVTRRSRVPISARESTVSIGLCEPQACAEGKVGAPCNGVDDDAACDTSPGAGDGWCDACAITGGESTENEMFILIGQYYLDPPS